MTDGEFTRVLTKQAVPRWLQNTYAYRILRAIGLQIDDQVLKLRQGLFARFPGYIPNALSWDDPGISWDDPGLYWDYSLDDRLAYISRDRLIRRGREENAKTFAARVINWWDDHKRRGNAYALLEQVNAYYQPNPFAARCVSRNGLQHAIDVDGNIVRTQLVGFAPDARADEWARVWIYYDHPIQVEEDGLWGDPGLWGDGGVWGLEMTTSDLEKLLSLPREWLPAHIGEATLVLELAGGDIEIPIV